MNIAAAENGGITLLRVIFKKFLYMERTIFEYFTQIYGVLKTVKLIKLTKIFELHCLIEPLH